MLNNLVVLSKDVRIKTKFDVYFGNYWFIEQLSPDQFHGKTI